jgi:hypothetical protein
MRGTRYLIAATACLMGAMALLLPSSSMAAEGAPRSAAKGPMGLAARVAPPGVPDALEPDDTPGQAHQLQPPPSAEATVAHTLAPAGDVDWTWFKAQASHIYRVETTDLGRYADTVLHLFGEDTTSPLAFVDDVNVEAGLLGSGLCVGSSSDTTYYARVGSYGLAGTAYDTYTMRVADTGVDDIEPDNVATQAVPVAMDSTTTRRLFPQGDVDFMSFSVVAGRRYEVRIVQYDKPMDTRVDVLDRYGVATIASNDDPSSGSIATSPVLFVAPASGKMLARVFDWRSAFVEWAVDGAPVAATPGRYALVVSDLGPNDAYEPDDAQAMASTITAGTQQAHYLFPEGDIDWVAFDGTSTSNYCVVDTLNLGQGIDTVLGVFDEAGHLLQENDDAVGGSRASSVALLTRQGHRFFAGVAAWDDLTSLTPGYDIRLRVFRRTVPTLSGIRVPASGRVRGRFVVTGRSSATDVYIRLQMRTAKGWTNVATTYLSRPGGFRLLWTPKASQRGSRTLRVKVDPAVRTLAKVSRAYGTVIW